MTDMPSNSTVSVKFGEGDPVTLRLHLVGSVKNAVTVTSEHP
jgi:hypothetical protein